MGKIVCTSLPHVRAPALRGSRRRTIATPYGVCAHTTGGGIVQKALDLGADPFLHILKYYSKPGNNFPHAVVARDGRLGIVADERVQAWGAKVEHREEYQRGWADGASPVAHLWRAAWPGVANPLSLVPSYPNNDLLHVELEAGERYTDAQYAALAAWVADVWRRYELPDLATARAAGRLLGHEDVDPIARSDRGGGWDPGAVRAEPRFDWGRLAALAVAGVCA